MQNFAGVFMIYVHTNLIFHCFTSYHHQTERWL